MSAGAHGRRRLSARDPGALRLASAGIGTVGVCYGMARYGYGLLLPDVRRDYRLGTGTLGAIGTASFAAYLGATALAGAFAARLGARRTAVAAGLLAAAGMFVAGIAQTPALFVAGILVAGASAGFAFGPFSDAARAIPAHARGRVLTAISCGTGYGVALAVPIAILAGTAWRTAWLAFAGVAVLVTLWTAFVLPGRTAGVSDGGRARYGWGDVVCRRSLPLLSGAVVVGLGSSAYWTFAVEHLTDAGALSSAASRSFLGVVGVASVLATLTADLVRRLGPRRAFVASTTAEAASLALLALAPSSFAAALVSAVLFGAAYNATLGIQALWSTEVFLAQPSFGIAAAMAANGTGMLFGPLAAGVAASAFGLTSVLLAGGAVVAAAGLLAPREGILPGARAQRGHEPAVASAIRDAAPHRRGGR
jgi:predicted MFS family arabinose efflux permease